MHSSDKEAFGKKCYYFGFIWKSNFWRVFDIFLDLVILVYFIAISKVFFCGKEVLSAIILCNFDVNKWENAYSKDLNAWGILMNFYLFIKVKKGGYTYACICIGTHSQP